MIPPKINVTKLGYKLACIPQFDSRSANFRVCSMQQDSKPLPDVLVSKHWAENIPSLDQGQQGSCTGNGFAHGIAADPDPVPNVDEALAVRIYNLARTMDGDPTPHEGSSVLAAAKASGQLGYITSYRWAATLKEICQALSYVGPVVVGVPWFEGMEDVDIEGFVHPTGQIMGGHCVAIVAIDVPPGGNETSATFTIKNSWGNGWGNQGHCRITASDFETLRSDASSAFCVPLAKAQGVAPLPTVPWYKRVWARWFA